MKKQDIPGWIRTNNIAVRNMDRGIVYLHYDRCDDWLELRLK